MEIDIPRLLFGKRSLQRIICFKICFSYPTWSCTAALPGFLNLQNLMLKAFQSEIDKAIVLLKTHSERLSLEHWKFFGLIFNFWMSSAIFGILIEDEMNESGPLGSSNAFRLIHI